MLLSIIVPVYGIEDYLEECIESILAQTFQDYELILVDDGSKDRCPKICDDFAQKDERIKVIHKENGGLVSARIAGLRVAKGQYIGYVDGDDKIYSDMYQQMCSEAIRLNCDMVICDIMVKENGKEHILQQGMEGGFYDKKILLENVYPRFFKYKHEFSFGFYPAMCNKIILKKILEKWQYKVNENIRLGEDAACSYFCILDSEKIMYLKGQGLYFYRTRENSMSRTYNKNDTVNIILLLDYLQEELHSFSDTRVQKNFLIYICYMIENIIIRNIGKMDNLEIKKQVLEDYHLIRNSKSGKELLKHYIKLSIPCETKWSLWYLKYPNFVSYYLYIFIFKVCKKVKRIRGY